MVFSLVLKIYLASAKVTMIEGSVSLDNEVNTEEDQFMSRVSGGSLMRGTLAGTDEGLTDDFDVCTNRSW